MKRMILLFDAVGYYLIYLFSGLVSSIILIIANSIRVALEYNSNLMLKESSSFSEQVIDNVMSQTLLALVISYIVMLLLFYVILRKRDVGIYEFAGLKKTYLRNIFGAVVAGALLNYFTRILIEQPFFPSKWVENYNDSMLRLIDANPYVTVIVLVFIAPIIEEFLFRGILLSSFKMAIGSFASIFITSLLFAISHGNLVQGTYAFLLGIVLATVRINSRSLWNTIFLHISFNMASFYLYDLTIPRGAPLYLSLMLLVISLMLASYRKKQYKKAD